MSDDEGASKTKIVVQGARPEVKINDDDKTISTRAKEVDSFIARQLGKDAILCAIHDPPIGSKNAAAKDQNFRTVMKALCAVKETEIQAAVENIYKTSGEAGTDALMKYIFRGLAEAENCGVLLKWHGVVVEVAGLGPIVRAMTDRKTV